MSPQVVAVEAFVPDQLLQVGDAFAGRGERVGQEWGVVRLARSDVDGNRRLLVGDRDDDLGAQAATAASKGLIRS